MSNTNFFAMSSITPLPTPFHIVPSPHHHSSVVRGHPVVRCLGLYPSKIYTPLLYDTGMVADLWITALSHAWVIVCSLIPIHLNLTPYAAWGRRKRGCGRIKRSSTTLP